MKPQARKHVVVEGPIGVGKTSLARRLAQTWDAELVLELADENPFLERFYRESGRLAALPAQLYFLLQRTKQLESLRQRDLFANERRVSDFLFDKDRLFAQITLDDDEFDLYDQVARGLNLSHQPPDLVIYLQAPLETLFQRIAQRNIEYEQTINREYLQAVVEAYTRFFYHYTRAPVLIVNTAGINLVDNDDDYAQLLTQLNQVISGKHFYNPVPVAL